MSTIIAKAGEYTDASKPQQQPSTADRLRARLKRLDEIEGSYTACLHDRIKERDWHGGWDVCVNLSEISCERDGLLFALEALGEQP
jgi:hypothetical protein